MTTRDVGLKLQATQSLIKRLNAPRSAYWERRLQALAKRASKAAVGADIVDGPVVDWDLRLANELDRIYTAVSDEATRVRKEASTAIADVATDVGWGLWPLAIAAVAIGWALAKGRGK